MSQAEYKNLPKIAIIGRPNVGKSSVFNRILGRRKAIIESVPGVTRDRLYAYVKLKEAGFILIDTGGLTAKTKDRITGMVYKQSRLAIEESEVIIFVCDVSAGITYQDEHVASLLKKAKKKAFLAVNKTDSRKLENDIFEFYRLGLGSPYGLSALHNRGFAELQNDIAKYILDINKNKQKKKDAASAEDKAECPDMSIRIAVAGRPNVGKSSFVNCILNQERQLVDETPGTTRDSVDTRMSRAGRSIIIVDTAGMRHKKKIKDTVEIFSLSRAKQSIRRSDVALVMLDAAAGLLRDDISVMDYSLKEGKCCVLLVNKWDLLKNASASEYRKSLCKKFRPLTWIPVLFTSCRERKNIIKAIDLAWDVAERARVSIPTPKLNQLLERVQRTKPHPACGRARPKIYYATQIAKSPLKFLLFVDEPKRIKEEYLRFIENSLRREFGLDGIPLFFQLRPRS